MSIVTPRLQTLGTENKLEDIIVKVAYYYEIYSKTLEDEAYSEFVKAFNEYIENIAPIKYIPGLPIVLGEQLVLSLWDAGVSSEEFKKLLTDIVELKHSRIRLDEVKQQLRKLSGLVMEEAIDVDRLITTPEDAVAFALLMLIVATNP